MVLLVFFPELEGANLCQAVVDIVERRAEDMILFYPEATFFEEGVAVVVAVWEVFLFHFAPDSVAFLGAAVGLSVDAVLEFIHGHAIGEELYGTCQVASDLFVSIWPEDVFHPGVGEELHRHRVDFAGLVGGPVVFQRL